MCSKQKWNEAWALQIRDVPCILPWLPTTGSCPLWAKNYAKCLTSSQAWISLVNCLHFPRWGNSPQGAKCPGLNSQAPEIVILSTVHRPSEFQSVFLDGKVNKKDSMYWRRTRCPYHRRCLWWLSTWQNLESPVGWVSESICEGLSEVNSCEKRHLDYVWVGPFQAGDARL